MMANGEYFKQRYSNVSNNILTKYPRPSGIPLHSFKKFSHIWMEWAIKMKNKEMNIWGDESANKRRNWDFHWCICCLLMDNEIGVLWKLWNLTFGAMSGRSSMRILNGSSLSTWTCWFWDKFIFNLEVLKWILLKKSFHFRIFSSNCSNKLGGQSFWCKW